MHNLYLNDFLFAARDYKENRALENHQFTWCLCTFAVKPTFCPWNNQ